MGNLTAEDRQLLVAVLLAAVLGLGSYLLLVGPAAREAVQLKEDIADYSTDIEEYFPAGSESPTYREFMDQVEVRRREYVNNLEELKSLLPAYEPAEAPTDLEAASRFVDRVGSTHDDAGMRLFGTLRIGDERTPDEEDLDKFGFSTISPDLSQIPSLEIQLEVIQQAIDLLARAGDPGAGGGRIYAVRRLCKGETFQAGTERRQFLMLSTAELELDCDLPALAALLAAMHQPRRFFTVTSLSVASGGVPGDDRIRVLATLAKLYYLPEEIRTAAPDDPRDPRYYHYYPGS